MATPSRSAPKSPASPAPSLEGPVIPRPRGRPRGRPPVISTERLLEVARQVFLELGIRATTAEVATRAGIAEGTIFHRFKSKEELFRAAMDFDPDSALVLVGALSSRAGVGDLRSTLVEFAQGFIKLGRVAFPVWMMAWSNPESQLSQERTSERTTRYQRVLGALTGFFETEMQAGRLRRADPRVMSRMLIGTLHHFCMIEVFMGGVEESLTDRQFAEKVIDVLLAGGVTP